MRRSRYEELRAAYPALFANPPDGAIYEILTDPERVAAAESAARARLVSAGLPPAWADTGVVFEDQYGIVVRDAVRMPDGSLGTYIRSLVPPAPGVVILPVHAGQVVLIRHFRHSTREWHLELPRGFGSPDSTPEDDARRELFEEIGASATELISLGRLHPDTGMGNTSVCLFAAHVDVLGPAGVDEGISDLVAVPARRLAELIRDGEITDGYTIAAYARAQLRDVLPG